LNIGRYHEVSDLNAEVSRLQEHVNHLLNQNKSLTKEIANWTHLRGSLAAELEELKDQLEAKGSEVAGLKDKLSSQEIRMNDLGAPDFRTLLVRKNHDQLVELCVGLSIMNRRYYVELQNTNQIISQYKNHLAYASGFKAGKGKSHLHRPDSSRYPSRAAGKGET